MVSLQYHICVVLLYGVPSNSFKKKSETIYYSLENCLLQLICTMYGIPEGTFSKTVGNTCFMFYTISSVMLFVSVSSACTFMFLVFESMLASYFVEWYVWSCVMFEERFTLCFIVVGEFSNVEIYVFVFFRVCLPSFPFATMSKVMCFFSGCPITHQHQSYWCGQTLL